MIETDLTTIGGRIWAIREAQGFSRRAFAERLGCQEQEIKNIEFNKLKKPELKESLYRNISATFGVSLDWIKTGEGEMFGVAPRDSIAAAFGHLASLHDPVIDGFILWLADRTPEECRQIESQLESCVDFIRKMRQEKTED